MMLKTCFTSYHEINFKAENFFSNQHIIYLQKSEIYRFSQKILNSFSHYENLSIKNDKAE